MLTDEQLDELENIAKAVGCTSSGWEVQRLGPEVKELGRFVYAPMWGAVAICPKGSPQFSAHETRMEHIAAFNPIVALELVRELKSRRTGTL